MRVNGLYRIEARSQRSRFAGRTIIETMRYIAGASRPTRVLIHLTRNPNWTNTSNTAARRSYPTARSHVNLFSIIGAETVQDGLIFRNSHLTRYQFQQCPQSVSDAS